MFCFAIIDFVGGYLETVFVPPFVTEWQQITAEKTIGRERRRLICSMATDMRIVQRKIDHSRQQLEEVIAEMHRQDSTLMNPAASGAERENQKTIRAVYSVHRRTVEDLRNLIYMLTRVKSQLMIRQAVVNCTTESMMVGQGCVSKHVREFHTAAQRLLSTEIDTQHIINIIREESALELDGSWLGRYIDDDVCSEDGSSDDACSTKQLLV